MRAKHEIFIDYSQRSGYRLIMVNNTIPSGYVIKHISADEAEHLRLPYTMEAQAEMAHTAKQVAARKAYYAGALSTLN